MREARAIVALNLDDILFMTNNKFSDPRIAKGFTISQPESPSVLALG